MMILAALVLAGCDERASAGTPDAAPPPRSPTGTAPTAAPTAAAKPSTGTTVSPAAGELKVLKVVFTSEVKSREPSDKLDAAKAGQRVYAHVTMRNRTGGEKPIVLAFLVDGAVRSKIDLDVADSWSYRTWGYVTLRDGDTGDLVAEVRDGSGTVMERARIPIKPKS